MSSFIKGFKSGIGNLSLNKEALGQSLGNAAQSLAPMLGNIAGGLISDGYTSGAGTSLSTLGSTVGSAIPGPWGAVVGAGSQVVGGLINRAFGSKESVDRKALEKANAGTNYLNNFVSNASSFDDIQGPIEQEVIGNVYSGKDGWFSKGAARRAREKNAALRRDREIAQSFADRSVLNNISNLQEDYMNSMMASYAAFGGPLHSHGADWSNGLTIIGNGGTHESNPFEGVPMGIAPDGQPNLVEEGEVIYNDYVYSNRIKVPKSVRDKYKLKGNDDMTFADAAKKAQKESEERPNDPISKRGLNDIMGKLMMEQESIREKREARKQSKFAKGGMLGRLFYGPGDEPNLLLRDPNDTFYITDFQGTPKVVETPQQIQARVWKENHPETTGIPTPARQTRTDLLKNTTGESTIGGAAKVKTNPLTALRFIPALGAAYGVFSDAMGWTNTPDYSNADAILNAAENAASSIRDVNYKPIGDYLTYNPLDRLFYANQLGAQAGATRRNILNTSGGNRGTAMAGLLAADYNATNKLGDLYRQAEEYNLGQRTKVAEFNRGTNMFNSEQDFKAQMANAQSRDKRASLLFDANVRAAALRDAELARASAGRAANLTNLFDSLGDIGREQFSMDMIKNNPALLYDWMGRYKGAAKAKGGYLTIKRRRR